MSKQDTPHIKFLKERYPNVDVDRCIQLFEETLAEVEFGTLEQNREMRLPLGCDLNKTIFINALNKIFNDK
jgi:hypothetical protein